MKKYILLISLFCFILCQSKADTAKDSVLIFKNGVELPDMAELKENLKNLKNLKFDFDFDSSKFTEMQKHFDSLGIHIAENMKNTKFKNYIFSDGDYIYNFNGKSSISKNADRQNQEPTRVENKTFDNISEIEFFHKFGDIVVQESNSKQVQLEIRYYDKKNQKGSATITTTNKLLTIATNSTGKSNSSAKIDYIVSVPKNVALNIDMKYGTVKIGRYDGTFNIDLSYSTLRAQALNTPVPVVKSKYSDISIDEVKDIKLSGAYSDLKIRKANRIDITGNYNDCVFNNVQTLVIGKSSSYGDLRLGTVASIEGDLKYADVIIDNLLSSMNISTAYGDITVKSVSTKVKNINIKASYADIAIIIPENLSVSFDARLTYGDFNVSKKYNVKYTELKETNSSVVKKGQIGAGTPSATMVVSNSYADIYIR